MDKKLIIANWKMNPQSLKEAMRFFEVAGENAKNSKNVEVVICAPFVYLNQEPKIKNKEIKLGAQNCFCEGQGAYTGEVSAPMLKNIGCEYVIIGHSERRRYFGEADEFINRKLKAVMGARMKPILCIGEKEGEKEQMKEILEKQLAEGLKDIKPNQISNLIVSYEPVWAISTSGGQNCSTDYAFSSSLVIRKFLINSYGKYSGNKVKIIYGGSVDSGNAAAYIKETKMDGVLVGAASLKEEEFGKIIKSVAEIM